jgi:hypothetical protein
MDRLTVEQRARDMLERIGVENAQGFSSGELVELANLIAEHDMLMKVYAETKELMATLKTAGWPV